MDLKVGWGQLRAKNMAIEQVESRLQTIMHPVAPPPGYVQDLGRRLRHKTGSLLLIPQPAPHQYTWLLFLIKRGSPIRVGDTSAAWFDWRMGCSPTGEKSVG